MENNQSQTSVPAKAAADQLGAGEILKEILENTRKTKNYLKWQMYITVVMVVLPILALAVMVPIVMKNLGNLYGGLL